MCRFSLLAMAAVVVVLLPAEQVQAQSRQPAAKAARPAQDHLALASEMLDKWHTRAQLEVLGAQLGKSRQAPDGVDRATAERLAADWRDAVATAFDANVMYGDVHRSIADGLTGEELTRLLRFSDTPFGQKLRAALKPPAVQPDEATTTARTAATLEKLDRDRPRKRALEAIIVAMNAVDATAGQVLSLSIGTAIGANAVTPAGQPRMDIEDIARMLQASRPQMRAALKPLVLGHFALMLTPLTLAELAQYHRELNTDVIRKYVRVSQSAVEGALKKQALAVGATFAKNMKSERL
jgi:cell division protein ZapA (FtsZ GTPase activity inhibitor)